MNGASSSGIGGAAAVASTTTSTSSSSTSGRQNRVKSECFAAAAAPGTAAALVAGRSAHPSAPSAMPSPHPALSAFGQQAARGPGVALERSTSGGTSGGPGSGAGRRSIDCGPLTPTPRSADARLFPHTSFSPSPHSPPTNPFSGGRAPPPVRHSIVELASGTGSSGPGAAACASMAAAAYSNPFREPKKQPQMMSTSPSPYEAVLRLVAASNGQCSPSPLDRLPDVDEQQVEGRCAEKISAWQAGWNITNAIQGMFLVSLPYAVLQGGWAALFSMLGVAYICCYTGEILVECLYEERTPAPDAPAHAASGGGPGPESGCGQTLVGQPKTNEANVCRTEDVHRTSAGHAAASNATKPKTNCDVDALHTTNPFATGNNNGSSSCNNNPYVSHQSASLASPEVGMGPGPWPGTAVAGGAGTRRAKVLVRVRHSYAEIAAAVLGERFGTLLVNAAQLVELLMTCILYLVLCGDLLGGVLEEHVPLGLTAWIVLGALPIAPCALLTSLRRVSTLSFWCTVAHLVINAIIFAYCVLRVGDWELGAVQLFPSVWSFPIALGIIIFSYTSQIFLPTLEGSMSDTAQFRPMLRWSHAAAAVCKTLFGLVGFVTFKSATQEVITNNLPPVVKVAVNGALIAKALLSYPLPYFAAVQLIEHWLFLGRERGTRFASCFSPTGALTRRALLLRLALICATVACAVAIPHFAHLMGLIGSFTGTMLSFVWPAYFHARLRWPQLTRTRRALDCFIVALGVVAGAVGIFYSSVGLVQVEAAGHAAFTAAEPAHLDAPPLPLPMPIYPKPPRALRKDAFLRHLSPR